MRQAELESPYQDRAANDSLYDAAENAARDDLWGDLCDGMKADAIIHRWVSDERELLAQVVSMIARAQAKDFSERLHAFRKAADFIEAELAEEIKERANKAMEE